MPLRYLLVAMLSCNFFSPSAIAEESEADAELLKAVATLDEAFSKRDKETIRSMTDPMHMSVFHTGRSTESPVGTETDTLQIRS